MGNAVANVSSVVEKACHVVPSHSNPWCDLSLMFDLHSAPIVVAWSALTLDVVHVVKGLP